ncbi:hypothetical protein WMY93_015719 [Mugilogobius chulae]|uniref:PiggyBac transposable element-derived protein domain-containing protein n=1 Tax=Mugilogobius chulae TaxID=88201 RepID=A0AAW0NRY5_9GOBI
MRLDQALELVMHPATSEGEEESDEYSTDEDSDSDSDSGSELDPDIPGSSSDSDTDENPVDPDSEMISKSGQVWKSTNDETTYYIPASRGVPAGPTRYAISRISDILSSFDLFITPDVITLLVSMTNLNGRRKLDDWKDVDAIEIRAYIGLLILAGVYRSKGESTESLWDKCNGRPIFRATMSHKRFKLINSTIRFDDKLTRPSRIKQDKLAPFRTLWEMWLHRLPLLFNPGKDVCVDEQLVGFRGRCHFRQYLPNKPAKYGIKIWITADVTTSYAWKCQIYTGKQAGCRAEVGQGKRVVLEMTEDLPGVTVTCDNFFTSFSLAEDLLKKKIAMVGTIRKNKPELPLKLLTQSGRPSLSSVFAFTKTISAVSYIPRRGKNVVLLSSKHREPTVNDDEKQKAVMITDYNRCKGAVDHLDWACVKYSCKRMTARWPQVLFFNMIDMSCFNSYVLFVAVEPTWNAAKTHRRRMYIEELGKSLVSQEVRRRTRIPRTRSSAAMVEEMQSPSAAAPADPAPDCNPGLGPSAVKRGMCKLCKEKRSKVDARCIKCGNYTCKEHKITCCQHCWKN